MSRDNEEINVPLMGPADPDELKESNKSSAASAGSKKSTASSSVKATNRQGDSWVTTLILVLLTAGCGVLGYLAFGMQSTLMEQRALLSEAQQQVSALEERLQQTSESASQSGETLQQQVEGLQQALDQLTSQQLATVDQNTQLEASIIQLEQTTQALAEQATDRSEQINRMLDQQTTDQERIGVLLASSETVVESVNQIAQMKEQLSEVAKEQALILKANSDQQQSLTELESSQQSSTDTANQAIQALAQRLDSLDQLSLQLQTQLAIFDETSVDRANQQQAKLAALDKRVASLDSYTKQLAKVAGSVKTDTRLTRRVATNEQAIAAIDGTRRQVNSELLNIRQQLNALSLKVGR